MKRATLYYALIAFLSLLMAACGGGSDGAIQLTGASKYTLTLTPVGPVNVTAAAPVTFTATLRAPDGSLVTGGRIDFRTAGGRGRLAPTSAMTAGGTATVTLFAGSGGPGSDALVALFVDPSLNRATVSVVFTTLGDEVAVVPGTTSPAIAVSVRDSSDTPSDALHPITSTAPGTLSALVVDSTGAPIPNVIVTFGAGAVASVSQGTALTNASGIAQVTITATGAGAGTATASATVGDYELSAAAVYSATMGSGGSSVGTAMTLEIRTSSGVVVDSANPLTNLAPGTLTATLTQGGTPLANQLVNFTQTGGVASLPQTSALTDSSGRAIVPITATQTGAGTATATANVGGTNVVKSAFFATSAGGGVSDTPLITLAVLDSANNPISAARPISNVSGGKLRATVTLAGAPQVGQVVTFRLGVGEGAALPQTVALTNSSGVAEVPVTAVTTGAGTVVAAATVNSVNISAEQAYATSVAEAQPLTLELGSYTGPAFTAGVLLSDAVGAIAPGASSIITADIRDTSTGARYTGSISVDFASVCTQTGKASIDASVASLNGTARAIYVPTAACVGSDIITATLKTQTQNLAANVTVNILAAPVGQIRFDSANPATGSIALKGTGSVSRPESAEVVFQVMSTGGDPLSNKHVCFDLSTTAGGIVRTPAFATSDTAGKVRVTVSAGNIPTPVRVSAYVDDNANCSDAKPAQLIQTVSELLRISTGLPDQKSFSVYVNNPNPLSYTIDGVEVSVSVYSADHFNNPVPDGTAVSFWAESGAIESSDVTAGGACTVKWRSQNPRSSVDLRDRTETGRPFRDRRGRATIMAYAVGEESFVDANGDGVWNETESFVDLSEAIKDTNGNGVLEPTIASEEYVDFNNSVSFDAANGKYDGVLCSLSARNSGTCTGNATVHVRDYGEVVMSTPSAKIYPIHPDADLSAIDFDTFGSFVNIQNPLDNGFVYSADGQRITTIYGQARSTFALLITDGNGNTLANGTSISISLDAKLGKVLGPTSYAVGPVSSVADWFGTFVALDPPSDPAAGYLSIEVKHPNGVIDVSYIFIDWVSTPP